MFETDPNNQNRPADSSLPNAENSWNDRLLYRVKQTVQRAMRIPSEPQQRPPLAPTAEIATLAGSIRQIAHSRVSLALRQLRAQHGLTYEQIQQRTGLSQQLLWDVEFNSRRLSLDELRELAVCYSLSVNDILGVDVDEPTIDKLQLRDSSSLMPRNVEPPAWPDL